jgi:hypothetical protein
LYVQCTCIERNDTTCAAGAARVSGTARTATSFSVASGSAGAEVTSAGTAEDGKSIVYRNQIGRFCCKAAT